MQPLVGDLVLTWDSVAGWPTVGDFPLRLDHPSNGTFEYVLCTSVNVGALQTTVTRAQESTSASGGFIVGSTGANALTKKTMDDAFVRLDTALAQTLTGPLSIPLTLGGSPVATSYGSMPLKAAENLLAGVAASVSFTSIPATFRHAKGEWYARGDRASVTTPMGISVNGAGTYDSQQANGIGATASAVESLGAASIGASNFPAATATANYFGVGWFRIHHYAGTVGNKLAVGQSFYGINDLTGQQVLSNFAGKLRTAGAAVNRIDFLSGVNNFIIGSLFTLWLEP